MGDTAAVRNRIRELYPGDTHKALRNRLYSKPGFLASDPTDEMIREEAGWAGETVEGETVDATKKAGAVETLIPQIPAKITNAEEYAKASEIFGRLSKMLRNNEARRKAMTKPILDAKAKIDDEFKAANAPIEAVVRQLDGIMKDFKSREREQLREQEAERQRIIQAEKAKAQAEVDANKSRLEQIQGHIAVNVDPFLAALLEDDKQEAIEETKNAIRDVALVATRVEPTAEPVKAEGSRTTYDWVWEVTDEAKIPREMLSLDPKKMNAYTKKLKDFLGGDITQLRQEDLQGFIIKEVPRIGGR